MQCPNCGDVSNDATAFCRKCGTLLAQASGPAPQSPSQPSGGTSSRPDKSSTAQSANIFQHTANVQYEAHLFQHAQTLGKLLIQYPNVRKPRPLDIFYRMHCPFCNFEFHPGDCAIYSATGYNKSHPEKSKLLYPAPKGTLERNLARAHVRSLDGKELFESNPHRQCPNCFALLPYSIEKHANFNIAVVGTGSSGKTHYIISLLHQIHQDFASNPYVSVNLVPLTPYTTKQYRELSNTLINNHIILPATPTAILQPGQKKAEYEPFIFQLSITSRQDGRPINTMMNLIFYDISGEDITNKDKMRQFGWPILEAQALIHAVDPLALPSIQNALTQIASAKKVAPSAQVEAAKKMQDRVREHEVLLSLISLLREYHKLDESQNLQIPVAIMLSKADVLEDLAAQVGLSNAVFLKHALYDGSVNIADLDAVDSEVRQFLLKMQENRLLGLAQHLAQVHFFASSPTGCAPEQQRYPHYTPKRILDPFLWVLHKLIENQSQKRKKR